MDRWLVIWTAMAAFGVACLPLPHGAAKRADLALAAPHPEPTGIALTASPSTSSKRP